MRLLQILVGIGRTGGLLMISICQEGKEILPPASNFLFQKMFNPPPRFLIVFFSLLGQMLQLLFDYLPEGTFI